MENQNNEHTDPWDMTENIYEILANDLSGEPLSTEEARLFEAWKQAHPANQAIYRQFRSLMERNSASCGVPIEKSFLNEYNKKSKNKKQNDKNKNISLGYPRQQVSSSYWECSTISVTTATPK